MARDIRVGARGFETLGARNAIELHAPEILQHFKCGRETITWTDDSDPRHGENHLRAPLDVSHGAASATIAAAASTIASDACA